MFGEVADTDNADTVVNLPQAEALQDNDPKAKVPYAQCSKCPLYNAPIAPSVGASRPRAFILSRSPGGYDTAARRPFSGPSGKVLDHLLQRNGVKRSEVFTTNVVLCQTEKPPKEAIECCKPRLDQELSDRKSELYIAAGSEAAQAITGDSRVRVLRGRRIAVGNDGATCIVTFNPAAAIRDDSVYPDLVADFHRAFRNPSPYIEPKVDIINDPHEAKQWCALLAEKRIVSVDIETRGLSVGSELLSIGFSYSGSFGFTFSKEVLKDEGVRNALSKLARCSNTKFAFHNGKFDAKLLRAQGYPFQVGHDSMMLSYLLDERQGVHSLDYNLQNNFDWPYYTPPEVEEGKKNGFRDFDAWNELYKYNAIDAIGTRKLVLHLSDECSNYDLLRPYYALLVPASNALADIEAYGILFDSEKALDVLVREVLPRLDELLRRAQLIASKPINLNSHKQVGEFLYDECGVSDPHVNAQRRNRSVDKQSRLAILELEDTTPTARAFTEVLTEFKELDKLRSTYLEGLMESVDADGRIRCDFWLHGTETGRLSSRNPNLQNQPRGKLIRQLYVAPRGSRILQADYSQAELRVAAMLSGDSALREVYKAGRDLHHDVATRFYGQGYSKEQRVRAKAVNFGILYGQGSFKFSKDHKIPIEEARRILNEWWTTFPEVKRWVRSIHEAVLDRGYLVSPFGRYRRFHLITDHNKEHTLKEAVNFLAQSTASDLTLLSLINIHNKLPRTWGHIIVTVHDSIVLEVKEDFLDQTMELVKQEMELAPVEGLGWDAIPFVADLSHADNWGDC